ncbi:MAG: hypothetical protein KF861_16140 [Planctomycetaceae bacterium]|nr:hypothetical protein [Planctomycetaceae bacterium]
MHCEQRAFRVLFFGMFVLAAVPTVSSDDVVPEQEELRRQLQSLETRLAADPKNVNLLSSRGDARFFLGDFAGAADDYDQMVMLNPELDASHWRRGIAWFYAQRYTDAARQFERYHSFDNVDRENGIWRYLCQVKAHGVEAARAGLLKYEKDDREPFRDVYRLFAGEIEPDRILERIAAADVPETEREKRRFYAHLYIGLWYAVHDQPEKAAPHLHQSLNNRWAPTAGYGPRYMWHVGRLHHQSLTSR